jgi:2-polyprenyl-3-methyl-5-hydroxy-6-metoxy-1,4-benzoquinol methylase
MSQQRLLILVVASNASQTLLDVLDRIPRSLGRSTTRVLVIDDASSDLTFEVGDDYRARCGDLDVEVLVNPDPLGYGGNQKLGFRYAIEHGFDAVALLHGDGQYVPETLPELVALVLSGEADAVLGTRMARPLGALRGGMPLYKLAGNLILTWIQNRLLNTQLTEFHSGYRVYGVSTIARIPFELNTDDFHFDTEIIIQLLRADARILELPIPVYSGDEIRRFKGLGYAANVLRTTVASRLHDLGVFYRANFDLRPEATIYDLKLGYPSSHTLALAAVPDGAHVLDVGCGRGLVGRELQRRGCRVHGLDRGDSGVPTHLDRFDQVDLDRDELPLDAAGYDVVLLLDILEHLRSPESFLRRLRDEVGADGPKVVISVPNIAFAPLRLRLLIGGFEYGREGILDLTHARLFTRRTVVRLLRQAGFRVESVRGIPAPFPKALGEGRLGRWLVAANNLLTHLHLGLFSYQVMVISRPRPTVRHLLARSQAATASRRAG